MSDRDREKLISRQAAYDKLEDIPWELSISGEPLLERSNVREMLYQLPSVAPVEPVPPSDTDIQNDLAPVPAPRLEQIVNELEMFRLALVDCIAHPAQRFDEGDRYDVESYRAGAKMAYSGVLNGLIPLQDALLAATPKADNG